MDYNASFLLQYGKEIHVRVLDILLLKLLFYGTFCRVGLVALNRKLGFPSREIDIQWKKGKYNQKMLCFITKPSIYHYLFQSRNKVVKVLITSSTTFWKKLGVFGKKLEWHTRKVHSYVNYFLHFCVLSKLLLMA